MTEIKVGIIEFVSDNTSMDFTFKYRMTDFLVEEINEKGEVTRFNPRFKEGKLTRTPDSSKSQGLLCH